MQQNFFDDPIVFDGYSALRSTENNCNILMEQPAMSALLPDISGSTVLDLGCGFGHNCADFVNKGASRVLGIDISAKMLEAARQENSHPLIEYRNMSITDISQLDEHFDLIYSSLAFHYIEDMIKLMKDINCLLKDGGILLFSQEHPIATATVDGKGYYIKDEQGIKTAYCFADYGKTGIRYNKWFVEGREYYHRTFSDVINSVINAGLTICEVCEPVPDEGMIQKRPSIGRAYIKPYFLIVKATK